jgi:hypothetical protein
MGFGDPCLDALGTGNVAGWRGVWIRKRTAAEGRAPRGRLRHLCALAVHWNTVTSIHRLARIRAIRRLAVSDDRHEQVGVGVAPGVNHVCSSIAGVLVKCKGSIGQPFALNVLPLYDHA